MNKNNLYKKMDLEEYFWGGSFKIDISDFDISTESSRLNLLDKVCEEENLHQLGESWKKLILQLQ